MLPKAVPLSWSEILLSLATNVHERETGVAVVVGVGVRLGVGVRVSPSGAVRVGGGAMW